MTKQSLIDRKLEGKMVPDHTAIRTALWRALHSVVDPEPLVFNDTLGSDLVDEMGWMSRPDMDVNFSKPMRASIVARARFIEDFVCNKIEHGYTQYVILGAGLDTFALRRPELSGKIKIFEIDQKATQAWKVNRLKELGLSVPSNLHFVPVDFESGQSWWDELLLSGFDQSNSTIVASTGVSMYLSHAANVLTLQKVSQLSHKVCFMMTFMLELNLLSAHEKAIMEFVMKNASDASTPFLSLYSPTEIIKLAHKAGFSEAQYISARDLFEKYFADRTDGLRAGDAEAFLVVSNSRR